MTTGPDFRTAELDRLAAQIIPAEHFEFSAETARDRFFKDTAMLDIKQLVHNRFRTNPLSMVDHMRDNLQLTGSEDLLDLGCGNAFVLEHLRPSLAGGSITGLDNAPAVLDAARQRMRGTATPCTWIEGSADDLSMLRDDSFDRVMANYMIHYVPDLGACFREVRRVMRPGGIFQLTTDRPDSMLEMYEVHFTALTAMGAPADLHRATPKGRLSLDNGRPQLAGHFDTVETVTWQDQLRFTEPEPFMEFYRVGHNHCCASSEPDERLDEDFFTELRAKVRAQVVSAIEKHGTSPSRSSRVPSCAADELIGARLDYRPLWPARRW
ncbi:class I SAM-dependent methyltransferase [Streptomyces sp. NPDC093111]|uniref:class I SAM-dependent methyltransferase n=1 Tax=Streptomyces sp. NPDC093111 TaxID=3154978 RepID=UPI003419692D